MRWWAASTCALLLVTLVSTLAGAAGKLGNIRSASNDDDDDSSSSSGWGSSSDDDDDDGGSVEAVYIPTPLESARACPTMRSWYLSPPYSRDQRGRLIFQRRAPGDEWIESCRWDLDERSEVERLAREHSELYEPPRDDSDDFDRYCLETCGFPEPPPEAEFYANRLAFDYGYDFEGVHAQTLRWALDLAAIRIDLVQTFFEEPLENGTDFLAHGEANLLYRFTRWPTLEVAAGLGARYLSNSTGGVNVPLRIDVFPVDHLVFSLGLNFGTIGDAGIFRAQYTVGLLLGHLEIMGGYNGLIVWNSPILETIHGPLIGLRLWY